MDELGRADGAARFDPLTFVKEPQVILRIISCVLRIISWVFSTIVFGCIASGGWAKLNGTDYTCLFGGSAGACGFGTAIGVLGFLACIALVAIDAYFDNISSVQLRKQVVIADLGCSGVFTFLFFVVFCYLTNKWTTRNFEDAMYGMHHPQAAIAFSFFSIFTWGGLTFFAWRRYQEGAANTFAPSRKRLQPADHARLPTGLALAPKEAPRRLHASQLLSHLRYLALEQHFTRSVGTSKETDSIF